MKYRDFFDPKVNVPVDIELENFDIDEFMCEPVSDAEGYDSICGGKAGCADNSLSISEASKKKKTPKSKTLWKKAIALAGIKYKANSKRVKFAKQWYTDHGGKWENDK